MIVTTFPSERLLDALYGSSKIEDKVIGTSRWSVHHEVVLELDGKFYRTTYSVGATEMQEESPWQDQGTVECVEVHKVTKLVEVTAWEPVP